MPFLHILTVREWRLNGTGYATGVLQGLFYRICSPFSRREDAHDISCCPILQPKGPSFICCSIVNKQQSRIWSVFNHLILKYITTDHLLLCCVRLFVQDNRVIDLRLITVTELFDNYCHSWCMLVNRIAILGANDLHHSHVVGTAHIVCAGGSIMVATNTHTPI